MDVSIFLAKLLGLYFLIIAADLLFRRHEVEKAVKEFAANRGLLVLSGSLSLFGGLAIVIGLPVYQWNWQGLITLVGYLLILRGLVRIGFPSSVHKHILACYHKKCWLVFFVLLIIGLILTYAGFVQPY